MNRIQQFFAAFVVLALGLVHPVHAQDWRLVDADQITPENYLILTVPMDDPAALASVAQEIATQFGVPLAAEWPLLAIAVHCLIYDASSIANVDALISAMEADDRIRTAQRVNDFETSETAYPDPLFPLQWSLGRMHATQAHLVSTGVGVRVGIVDSAVDSTHPDLSHRVIDKRDFVKVAPASYAEAHGTAVAGVIAADATNAAGMVGVAPDADLIGLRACWQTTDGEGKCNSFSLARALNFAIVNDIDVINLSVGGPDDPLITELVVAAMEAGSIVVAASGETEITAFPASVSGVIAAGAGMQGRIPAPMVDVISTAPDSRHRYVSGSSIAAAHVSGVVALLLAEHPDLTPSEVTDALDTALVLEGNVPMLDACKALNSVGGSPNVCQP